MQDFSTLVAPDAKPKQIGTGYKFADGPVFSRRGYLLFTDVFAQKLYKYEQGAITLYRDMQRRVSALTFDHQGRLLACEQNFVTRTEKDGKVIVLANEGIQTANDLVYAIDGSIYFTDTPKSKVYQITRKGQVRVVAEDCQGPNGIALGPNQQTLFVADARQRKVRVYDIAGDGSLTKGRDFAQTRCDGLKTDESGNVWVAAENGIAVFDAQGKPIGSIPTPEPPANLNWGSGFHGLYIAARTSIYYINTKSAGTRTY